MGWISLVGRVILALYFIYSGVNHFSNYQGMKQYTSYKGVLAPGIAVVVTGLMLLGGGLSILTGYCIGWGVGLLVVFLVASAFLMHNFWTVDDPMTKVGEKNQFMKNIALAAAALLLLEITDWSW
ncbi:DoxX family membrane protein [Robertmurraya sp.]|uniref:DoxX family membrane protein n=1 Tax=Robertmurraya sp. TaxID=2837525 RepID=UPI00370440C4